MLVYFICMAWMTSYWAFFCCVFLANNANICSWTAKKWLFAILIYILSQFFPPTYIFSKFFRLSTVAGWLAHCCWSENHTRIIKKLHNLSALFAYSAHSVALFIATLHHSLLLYAWIPAHIHPYKYCIHVYERICIFAVNTRWKTIKYEYIKY